MGFSNLKQQLAIAGDATAKFTLDTIRMCDAGSPVLTVRHAGESNFAYWNAAVRASNENQARVGAGKLTTAGIRLLRETDAKLFADHVVVSWENVVEEDGKPADCSPAKVFGFLLYLLNNNGEDVLDAIRSFAKNADNFRVSTGGAEKLGKG